MQERAYLFRHALMQEVAYQLQPPSQRSELHGRIVRLMEKLFAGQLEEHAIALADHASRAHEGENRKEVTSGLRNKEVRYLQMAADVAQKRYDNGLAIGLLRRLAGLPWTPPTVRFSSLESIAQLQLGMAQASQATQTIQQLLELARHGAQPAEESRALLLLAKLASLQGRHADSLAYGQQAEYQAARTKDPALQMHLHSELGVISHRRGETGQSLAHFEKGLKLARELGQRSEMVSVLNRCGALHLLQGRLDEAELLLNESAVLARELDDQRNLAAVLANLGVLSRRRNQLEKALALYDESIALSLRVGLRESLMNSTDNRGVVLNLLGRTDEAQQAHDEARQIARELGDKRREAASVLNMALVQRKTGKLEAADQMLSQSLALCREAGDVRGQVNALTNRGLLRIRQKEAPFEALHDFIYAEALASGLGSHTEVFLLKARQLECLVSLKLYEDVVAYGESMLKEPAIRQHHTDALMAIYFNQGFAREALGQAEAARQDILQFIQLAEARGTLVAGELEDLESARALLGRLTTQRG
ncbi:MAG: tetratricopeptide repeat protein [Planctomycetota bacterium]